jgi:hypothetical protein
MIYSHIYLPNVYTSYRFRIGLGWFRFRFICIYIYNQSHLLNTQWDCMRFCLSLTVFRLYLNRLTSCIWTPCGWLSCPRAAGARDVAEHAVRAASERRGLFPLLARWSLGGCGGCMVILVPCLSSQRQTSFSRVLIQEPSSGVVEIADDDIQPSSSNHSFLDWLTYMNVLNSLTFSQLLTRSHGDRNPSLCSGCLGTFDPANWFPSPSCSRGLPTSHGHSYSPFRCGCVIQVAVLAAESITYISKLYIYI